MFPRLGLSVVPRLSSRHLASLSFRHLASLSRAAEAAVPLLTCQEETSQPPLVMDLTLGTGSTSSHLLEKTEARVLAVDVDPRSSLTMSRLTEEHGGRFQGYQGTWSSLPGQVHTEASDPGRCDLVMMELGPSTAQLEEGRGFASSDSGPLDMRYSHTGLLCSDLLRLGEMDHLVRILKVYGGVLKSKMVVSEIIERRYLLQDIKTVPHLLQVLHDCHGKDTFWRERDQQAITDNIDKVFSACRRFINNEINELFFAIRMAEQVLRKNGFLVIDTKSEFERNLIIKYLYRDSGKVDSEGGSDSFTNTWEQQSHPFIFKKIS